MIQLEIWFDRALGTPFELELNRMPATIEYERRDATTYKRRTATPWLVYAFRHVISEADIATIIEIANRVEERYKKRVRIYPSVHLNTDAAQPTSD